MKQVNQSQAYCVAVCSIKSPQNPLSEMISSLFANFLRPFMQGGLFCASFDFISTQNKPIMR